MRKALAFIFVLAAFPALVRADAVTSRISLTLPTVGGDYYTWGTILNNDLTLIDQSAAWLSTPNVFTSTNSFTGFTTFGSVGQSTVTATGVFQGNGSGLTNIPASAITGGGTAFILNQNTLQAASTAYPQYLYVGSSETISGASSATTYSGNGAALTNLNGSNVASGTIPAAALSNAVLNQNTLQSGSTSYPQFLYVGSTATISGTGLSVGGVPYSFPGSQGGASTILQNNGSGGLAWVVSGGGQFILNQNTLQANSTAYPQYLYVGSSATIGGLSPLLSQNTLQASTTAYPQFLYVGSSATIPSESVTTSTIQSATIPSLVVSTITGASFEAYRRPEIMSYNIGTSSAVAISTYTPNGIDGILNQVTAWFPNGVITSTNTLTPATILWATGTYSCSGTIQGGMAPGEQVATGAKYRIYAVLCPNLVDWTIAASTNDAIQANRATLNTLFGYRRYFPLGLEFNGVQNTNNGNTGGGFVPFYQSGNKTCFLNSSNPIENSGTTARGVAVTTGTASGTSLTYTPTSGMTGTSIPPTLGYITWTAINGVGSTNSWTVYDSNQRFTYWSQVGNTGGSGTVNVEGPAFSGLKVVNTAGSAGIDFFIGCFTDTALTGPFGSAQ